MRRTPRTYQTAADRWAGIGPYYAMFPVWFADAVVREFTVPGDVVVDPFAGRGTSIFSASVQGREVVDGIDESRRLGIEESVSREEIGQRSVGTVRRRPATDLEMLHIVFERLHQRLIILPAVARALQRFLGVHEIVWRVDPEFASLDRLPELEAGIDGLLPHGVDEIAAAYQKVRDMMPYLVPPTRTEIA